MKSKLENVLLKNQSNFRSVVDFKAGADKLLQLDFTAANKELSTSLLDDTNLFSHYINDKLTAAGARYGIGGYNEDRILYKRSNHFEMIGAKISSFGEDAEVACRSIHLGIDIWGPAGTKVFVPIGGTVHSFAYNDNFGDYGATIILQHQLETVVFHTLYGHLSLADLVNISEGKYISRGELLAHFGEPKENGDWPPHLHFQVIDDMRISKGDYPGVCTINEREKYLKNCPDANLVLNMMQYV
ncbi:MAG: peptidoglycan DD-metalloendopeptidase family protein [Ferruginibacter sp.]|nr:peptidoglycan DD-metalloendopeptidase family protein [Ferruginibacter sp.]